MRTFEWIILRPVLTGLLSFLGFFVLWSAIRYSQGMLSGDGWFRAFAPAFGTGMLSGVLAWAYKSSVKPERD